MPLDTIEILGMVSFYFGELITLHGLAQNHFQSHPTFPDLEKVNSWVVVEENSMPMTLHDSKRPASQVLSPTTPPGAYSTGAREVHSTEAAAVYEA